ncbi:hypothetical protein AMECASPLE_021696 [Ameca splendens]|uniref:Uncharacterized protein n=1 Tax=Ameca splendens TaxID=208324 RepID=A0ABV0YR23_9TELE
MQASGSDYTLSQSECVCGSPAVRARTSWDYYWLAAQHRQGSIWGGVLSWLGKSLSRRLYPYTESLPLTPSDLFPHMTPSLLPVLSSLQLLTSVNL